MTARRLILVRHGESVWNVERRVQGHTCRGLTEHGRVQAERTAEVLASRFPGAVVIASDLGRCQDTAAPIASALGVTLASDADLRERFFGRWEGMNRDELEQDDPDRYRRWRSGQDVIAEVGGESDATLRARAAGVFSRLLDAAQAGPQADVETVVAVTHGGTIWYGIHEVLRLAAYRLGEVHNASVTELVIGGRGPAGLDPDAPRMLRFNETAHL